MSTDVNEDVPWLKRHREVQKLVTTISRLKHIYVFSSEDIIKVVGERYNRVKRRKPGAYGRKDLELRRLETVYNTVYSRLSKIARLPSLKEMSSFHRALVESFVGLDYEKSLQNVRKALRLIRRFWEEYRLLIVSSNDSKEASRYRREGSGRILSVVRRLRRDLELLRKVRNELLHTHIVSEGLPIIVVAGIPSSGKSTLVKRLSTAQPEIAPYPFTTKTIIVGKSRFRDVEFYLVDTPGILERPSSEQNEIERKAFAAIASLPDVLIYLFDPSEERVQGIEAQVHLLRDIYANIIKQNKIGLIIAINKIDIANNENIVSNIANTIKDVLMYDNTCSKEIIKISALTGQGVNELLESIYSCLRKTTPWLFIQ